MEQKYHGVIPPIITPVTAKEEVDEGKVCAHCVFSERCIEGGLHGIFVCGSNGETMQLTQRQRERAIQIAIDQVNGRLPVVCGAMDSSTMRALNNVKTIERLRW